jgi:hypothetical protein
VKRLRIPGLVDRIDVDDLREISKVIADPRTDREFHTPTVLVNWFLLKRSLSALSLNGKRFPTMTSRAVHANSPERDNLWNALQARIPGIRQGPAELEPLAKWITGSGSDAEIGIITQQLLGSLFSNNFRATPESWRAAQILVAAPRLSNIPKLIWWSISGKVRRAKTLLAAMVSEDLSAVNAIGIAVHNVVKGMKHMRSLYSDDRGRCTLTPEEVAKQCLFAPINVFRQATAAGNINGCPFSRHSLFVLNIGVASKCLNGDRLVFLQDTWSGCPAADWVPAMLEGVWRRALTVSGTTDRAACPSTPPQNTANHATN